MDVFEKTLQYLIPGLGGMVIGLAIDGAKDFNRGVKFGSLGKPISAQVVNYNGDSLSDLYVTDKAGNEYLLIGTEEGKYTHVNDVIQGKLNALEDSLTTEFNIDGFKSDKD